MEKRAKERDLVRMITQEIESRGVPSLKIIRREYRPVGVGPREITQTWEKGPIPMNLQPDLVFVFQDYPQPEPLLVAVEVKLFQSIQGAEIHAGWGQVLSYALLGFDGVSLWHFFLDEPAKDIVEATVPSEKGCRKHWMKNVLSKSPCPCPLKENKEVQEWRKVLKADLRIPH